MTESDENSINQSYKRKKVINIVLKSEMPQLFQDTFLLQMTKLLWDGGSIIYFREKLIEEKRKTTSKV